MKWIFEYDIAGDNECLLLLKYSSKEILAKALNSSHSIALNVFDDTVPAAVIESFVDAAIELSNDGYI